MDADRRLHDSSEFWLISAPGDRTCQQTWDVMNSVTSKQANLSTNFKFHIPDLKVLSLVVQYHVVNICIFGRQPIIDTKQNLPITDSADYWLIQQSTKTWHFYLNLSSDCYLRTVSIILYYVWTFVYFFCFQTPPKRRVVRRQNLARSRVTTMSRTSVGFCIYRGCRYQKMTGPIKQ